MIERADRTRERLDAEIEEYRREAVAIHKLIVSVRKKVIAENRRPTGHEDRLMMTALNKLPVGTMIRRCYQAKYENLFAPMARENPAITSKPRGEEHFELFREQYGSGGNLQQAI